MTDPQFTEGVTRRDRKRWPYAHLLSATDGTLLIETIRATESSLRMEVAASAGRIAAGEANRGGKVPGRIDVDGVTEETWRAWTR